MIETGGEDRNKVIEYLCNQLIGPVAGRDEVLPERPFERYTTGILYPLVPDGAAADAAGEGVDEAEPIDEAPGGLADDNADDPITLSGQVKPSSVGLSFVTSSWSAIDVEVRAGRYIRSERSGGWARVPLDLSGLDAIRINPPHIPGRAAPVRMDRLEASLDTVWRRRHDGGAIVTVVLVNRRANRGSLTHPEVEDCLFQVGLRCRPSEGHLERYPSRRHLRADDEAEELDLLYRKVPIFALGHGAAARWPECSDDIPAWVESTFLPTQVVPDVSFDVTGNKQVLDLGWLARIEQHTSDVLAKLDDFLDGYRDWAGTLRMMASTDVEPALSAAAQRVLGRIDATEARMRRGVRLLESDPVVRRAFALANKAMLMQMIHSSESLAGGSHSPKFAREISPAYPGNTHTWRPFQLGFLLLTLDGVANDSDDRDLVDLIWFPTGGGKTEAYLGLAAFTILLRRLRDGDDGAGTTVMTRYTLRLLTAQQFRRASTLVCALEMLRRDSPDELGSIPISIGLWVGSANSPNTFAEAGAVLSKLRSGASVEEGFQIERCPWCGTRVVPTEGDGDDWGIYVENNVFRVFCLNQGCPFLDRIPVSTVDEDLYESPPTVLIGTVDKFAMTVWNARAGVFFGSGNSPGPSLVIQDEFHLISGPLGTVVGLYEAAFDVLMARNGLRPKIVASTATIRRADEQTRGVFGRNVALFPPAGLDADDSYFVQMDRSKPGRAYVGLMPQGHTPVTGLVHLAAALLQAAQDVDLSPETADAYWTLVAYHNSLRELGKTVTMARDDIPLRLRNLVLADDDLRGLDDDTIVELTSNVPAVQILRTLDRLQIRRGEPGAVSLVASTNMLSVGVDVPRLGLMVVVGQPKTTAEYIQATSRVGRKRERPGLVVTLYSPSKPRDRSHYESFVSYHSTLYRSVEPTSVTPFSVPARGRALHACLVLLARHARGWSADEDAARFDRHDPEFRKIVDDLLARAERAEPDEIDRVRIDVERLLEDWESAVTEQGDKGGLRYRRAWRSKDPSLLRSFMEDPPGWPTLNNMRSVDAEITVRVEGVRR